MVTPEFLFKLISSVWKKKKNWLVVNDIDGKYEFQGSPVIYQPSHKL